MMPLLTTDLGFTKSALANLIFLFSLAYAMGQYAAGALADRAGARRVVFGGMLLSAACNGVMAGTGALPIFAVLQFFNGLGQSCGWPGVVKLTGAWFPPERRGVLMAWWTTNYVVGGFVASLFATWLATESGFGWRAAALGPSLSVGVIAFIFFLSVPDTSASPAAPVVRTNGWAEVLRSPDIWSIAGAYFSLKLMRYSFLFWLPMYLVEGQNQNVRNAGYLSSVYEVVGFAGVLMAGYTSDRLLGGRRFPVGTAMMFGLALACYLFPVLATLGMAGTLAAIGLVGMLTFGPDTLMSGAATQESVSNSSAATAAGFVNGTGTVGQLISPFVVTATVQHFGWNALFSLFAVMAAAGGLALSMRWNRGMSPIRAEAAGG
jgi:sugar phosphate permease